MNEMFVYPVIDMKKTGENIRALREKNGMSAKDLQEIFGFTSPQAIYKWQWGQTLPDLANLLVMARLWNVSVEDILVLEHQDVSSFTEPAGILIPERRLKAQNHGDRHNGGSFFVFFWGVFFLSAKRKAEGYKESLTCRRRKKTFYDKTDNR